jgi:hypothetical protein
MAGLDTTSACHQGASMALKGRVEADLGVAAPVYCKGFANLYRLTIITTSRVVLHLSGAKFVCVVRWGSGNYPAPVNVFR